MRPRIWAAWCVCACCAFPLFAQVASQPAGPPPAATKRPARAKPAPQPAQPPPPVPSIFLDGSSLGSPLRLDKNWRVGISADPSAATPGFDDSRWAIRDAQSTIADVPEPDESDAGNNPSQSGTDAKKPVTVATTRRYVWFRLHIKLAPCFRKHRFWSRILATRFRRLRRRTPHPAPGTERQPG